jgi:hypothetical protein
MTGASLVGILITMAAIVVGLVVWLCLVFWAGRRPYYKRYQPESRRGDVRDGAFRGDGRSVQPHRDAPPGPDRGWQRDGTRRSP